MFKEKIVVITGGAKGIGLAIAKEFEKEGAVVCVIDILPNGYFQGDVANKATLETFAVKVLAEHGRIDFLINNALPISKGLDSCTFEEFEYAMQVGVTAPFYLTKLLKPKAAVVNISSTRAYMSQAQTESYTAAKGGISALTHAMALLLAGKVRVNSISPGWIDTTNTQHDLADAAQHPAGRVGNPMDVAHMALFLCSPKAGFITGQDFIIDGGASKQMIYSGENGWAFKPANNK